MRSRSNFYRTRVRSLGMLVSNSLTNWLTDSLLFSKLDACENCCVDPSPIIGYACHSLPNWLSHCCLVNLMPVNIAVLTRVWSLAILDLCEPDMLKFIRQRIVYSFLKLWRAFLDWNQIVKPFYSWYRLSKPRQEERQSQYFISILHVQRNELSFSFLNGSSEEIHYMSLPC